MKGTVSNYTRFHGWGFIVPDDENAPNYFVHYSFIQANSAQKFLKVGQRVEFDPTEVDGNPKAYNVRKLDEPLVDITAAPKIGARL
jgi:cold shock CspA family protein